MGKAQARLRMLSKKYVYKSCIYLIYFYDDDLVSDNLQCLICQKNSTKLDPIYLINMYKNVLALNNLQCLIFHKTRGVIVIVVGNEHGDTSSNPGRD